MLSQRAAQRLPPLGQRAMLREREVGVLGQEARGLLAAKDPAQEG